MQKKKISKYIRVWKGRCYKDLPDELPSGVENSLRAPSYKMICKAILKNDLHCTTLGYAKPESQAVNDARRILKQKTQPELF